MDTTTARPTPHVIGILAVLLTAVLAVVASPVWLLATALLAAADLARLTLTVWRTGRIGPAVLPLGVIDIGILAAAAAVVWALR